MPSTGSSWGLAQGYRSAEGYEKARRGPNSAFQAHAGVLSQDTSLGGRREIAKALAGQVHLRHQPVGAAPVAEKLAIGGCSVALVAEGLVRAPEFVPGEEPEGVGIERTL